MYTLVTETVEDFSVDKTAPALYTDVMIRPSVTLPSLGNLVGLMRLKQQVSRSIVSCRIRGATFGHTLLTGLGGTGKTTIARGIAQELGYHFVETEAAELKTRDHVSQILVASNKAAGNRSFLLFIDEIHRLSLERQEALYIPMTNHFVNTQGHRFELKAFTLVGATTRRDMLDAGSFVTRFQNVWDIGRYSLFDMEEIVEREFGRMGLRCYPAERTAVARRCLGIPRVALNLVGKVRDQVLYEHASDLTVYRSDIMKTFSLEELDEIGLNKAHITYLVALLQSNGQPKGLAVLAALLGRNKSVVEDTVEPILLSLGFVSATPKGRILTEKGFRHLAYQGLA